MKPRKTAKGERRVLLLDERVDLETLRNLLTQAGWRFAEIDEDVAEALPPQEHASGKKHRSGRRRVIGD